MKCSELREYLFAFLDNELDAALSIEVQRHLEHCCDCAREAEIERTVRGQLASAAAHSPEVPLDEDLLLRQLAKASRDSVRVARRNSKRRDWAVLIAIASCIAVAAGIWHWGADANAGVSRDALADDFRRFLAEGQPVQIASDDRTKVADWARSEIHLPVDLPIMHGNCKLKGARKCNLSGQTALLASYDVEGAPATLLVFQGRQESILNGMRKLDANRRAALSRGCTIVAGEHENMTYAAISMLPEERLMEFVPSTDGGKQ